MRVKRFFGLFFFILFGCFLANSFVFARAEDEPSFKTLMRATDAVSALAGESTVVLWGVEAAEESGAAVKLRARSALDQLMGGQAVKCQLKKRRGSILVAQCLNHDDVDLGLYMLQNGFVTVDRAAVFGSVFEGPYVQAEEAARQKAVGIWVEGGGASDGHVGSFVFSLGLVLFLAGLAVFAVLSVLIMRGFQRVVDAQNKNMEMSARERALKDKERRIFATMLDSEIKANKSKIEAYLVVYEEMLKSLRDSTVAAKYKSAGDIVQKQPALSRSVFDRNTDKLDVLGDQLSSDVIHFYARIKSKADYTNIEPDMPLHEVIEVVETAMRNARRLDKISDRLIDLFAQAGLASQDYDEDA